MIPVALRQHRGVVNATLAERDCQRREITRQDGGSEAGTVQGVRIAFDAEIPHHMTGHVGRDDESVCQLVVHASNGRRSAHFANHQSDLAYCLAGSLASRSVANDTPQGAPRFNVGEPRLH